MKWEHINILQRKAIASGLSKHKSLKEIAEITNLDPTSISKEISRNRIKTYKGKKINDVCKKILRFPKSAVPLHRLLMLATNSIMPTS